MISDWKYCTQHEYTQYVKNIIQENNYTSVDIGASIYYWSYPQCKTVVDAIPIKYDHTPDAQYDTILKFDVNLDNTEQLNIVLEYVAVNGKFDYSICSHTLEDVYNPIQLCNFLTKISHRGYIAVPSKFNEFRKHYDRPYYGYAHHKSVLDIIDNTLHIFPKYSFIETNSKSTHVFPEYSNYTDLILFWESDIPVKIFGSEEIFLSDDSLINKFYDMLTISLPTK